VEAEAGGLLVAEFFFHVRAIALRMGAVKGEYG
jgi:hypothetical protein